MFCKNCGNEIANNIKFCNMCGKSVDYTENTSQDIKNSSFNASINTNSTGKPKRYIYKVFSSEGTFVLGKSKPDALERVLNSYARQGWRVISCTANHQYASELVVILEKEI